MKRQVLVTVIALMCLVSSLGMTGLADRKVIVQSPAVVLLAKEVSKLGPLAVRLVRDLYTFNLRITKEVLGICSLSRIVYAPIRGPKSNNIHSVAQRLL